MAKTLSLKRDDLLRQLADHPDDEAAWHDLYVEFWPFVFGTIYRLLNGNTEQARDLSQEIFVRLAKYRPFASLKSAQNFRAYLGTACRNIVYDFLRHARNDQLLVGAELENRVAAKAQPGIRLREELQHIYYELSKSERCLLDLLIAGANPSEIASRLKLSKGGARIRVHRLRVKMKNILRES